MKSFSGTVLVCLALGSTALASESLDRARQMLKAGDSLGAKTLLAQVAQRNSNDIVSLSEYAEFLDHHGDPAALWDGKNRPQSIVNDGFATIQ